MGRAEGELVAIYSDGQERSIPCGVSDDGSIDFPGIPGDGEEILGDLLQAERLIC